MNKIKEKKRANIEWLMNQQMDVKSAILEHYMELSRMVINSFMEQEVSEQTGERYEHQNDNRRVYRWGHNPGSVHVGSQRIRVDVPRLMDKSKGKNLPLKSYERMRNLPKADDQMVKSVLHGISMRDYGKVVHRLEDSFGLSSAKLSREFVKKTEQALKEFESRKLDEHEFLAIFMDGKHLAAQQIIIALGITSSGKKIPLGLVQMASENSQSIGLFLENLIERGLNYKNGILFITDGSKGIQKGIKDIFGTCAVMQRCQWHKRENIVSYLKKMHQEHFRKRIQEAYNEPEYLSAKSKLMKIKNELKHLNREAANSLEEGMEETLTIHRLNLYDHLSRSFTTTNCIESVNSNLVKFIHKIKRWSSNQRYRWVAAGLMEIETKLRKVCGYKHLPLLKDCLKHEVQKQIKKAA